MDATANLGLPLIAAAQAQKHVTHNEAIVGLDALVQLAVISRSLSAPPGAPAEGDRYIVAAAPTGAWAGHAEHVALWHDGAWTFYVPKPGWVAFVIAESVLVSFDGAAWSGGLITALQNLTLLGVGTTADAANPFSTKLNNVLHTAKSVAEGGSGSIQVKLSKESAAKTASYLFQTNFSGRAEFGLIGDDNFAIKVSPDGATFASAVVIDKTTGVVNVPKGLTGMAIPIMGNSGSGLSAGQTRYTTPGLLGTGASAVYVPVPLAGTFSGLTVVTAGAPGAGESWIVTLQKLFSDTALTCTISGAGSNQASDFVNSVAFGVGERWSLKIVASAGAAASGVVLFSLKFSPTGT